jgi:hypothetical protein
MPNTPGRTIATRVLRHVAGNRDVAVEISEPVPTSPSGEEWVCEVTVRESNDPTVLSARGVDGLQALLNALMVTRKFFAPRRNEFAWLGMKREFGLPLIAGIASEDEARLAEALMEVEALRTGVFLAKRARREQ